MKKELALSFIFLFSIVIILPLMSAALNATAETAAVDKAYSCLQNKVNTTAKCTALTVEEKAFAVLATGSCVNELQNQSSNSSQCWPNGGCRLKTTALAVLALDSAGVDTTKAESWLLAQKRATTELSWFLEIESSTAASCTISYATGSYPISIGADKKISADAGLCLTRTPDNYWLSISPSCFAENFDVTCDRGFLTTLLFKKPNSPTVHVLPESSSASAGGRTNEQVESYCFTENNLCSYEGTLWASFALDSAADKEIDSYLPYLVTLAPDFKSLMPEVFLYFITADSEYRTAILGKQKSNRWWLESGDKFYDTALALFPFQQETLEEKTDSKEYLISIQDPNGCWENNIRNTAFILTSVWPRGHGIISTGSGGTGTGSGGLPSCTDSGYSCTTSAACGGQILSEFGCATPFKCCSIAPEEQTCSELGGEICSSNQVCRGGTEISSGDLDFSQSCCVSGGSCEAVESESTDAGACGNSGGVCRSFGCNEGEEVSSLSCSFSGDSCCMPQAEDSGSLLWVWILLILIVLVVFAIIFRDRLKALWFRLSSRGKGPQKPTQQAPLFRHPENIFRPRSYPVSRPQPQIPQRPTTRGVVRPKSGAQKELDEVLRKLKDMAS